MAVTLEQAKLNVLDALQQQVIDEYRKSSWLWDNLTFDNCVSPVGGGATMTYAYNRVTTQPTAAFRAINTEYSTQEAAKTRYTVDLAIFGENFAIDRVLADMAAYSRKLRSRWNRKSKRRRRCSTTRLSTATQARTRTHSYGQFDRIHAVRRNRPVDKRKSRH